MNIFDKRTSIIGANDSSLVNPLTYASAQDINNNEDIAQEVFVEARKKLNPLGYSAKLKSWLCGILRLKGGQTRGNENKQSAKVQSENIEMTPAQPLLSMSESDQRFVEDFNQLIEANYRDSGFNVPVCAAALNLSNRQLARKLNELAGEKFTTRLRDHRLEQSLALFTSGMHIGQIGDAVGFSAQSYFAQCFKAKYGKTPSQYQSEVVIQRNAKA